MYLYNTTFAVNEKIAQQWAETMRSTHLQNIQIDSSIRNIRFCKIIMEPQEGYTSYAFQFEIDSLKSIRNWKQNQEAELLTLLKQQYGENVLTFSTVMEIL